MAAITFPSSPYQYQIYTVGAQSWQWDGATWLSYYNQGADVVYGTGANGDATFDGTTTVLGMVPSSSVYSMTQDMYFNDLTLGNSVRLSPNGYRIFVKGTLRFGTSSTIGYTTGYANPGSIYQGGAPSTSVTNSLGGNASTTYTATVPSASAGGSNYYKQPLQAITGYSITASGGPTWLRGGAGGASQSGGGVIILAARYISGPASGTGYIKAPGTSPAGGGVIIVVSSASALPATISTDVTGANAGTVNYIQQV